jgi:hypothetical protein
MPITIEDIEPVVAEKLSDESEVSSEFIRKAVDAVLDAILTSSRETGEVFDVVVEDVSGEVALLELKAGVGKTSELLSEALDEKEAVILTGSIVETLASAMTQWKRHNRSYREVLEALVPRDRGPLSTAGVLQASRNARARSELLEEFPALTSSEVADAAGSKAANRASLANRWREERKVFAIRVGEQLLYPAFQFDDDSRPLDVMGGVLEYLGAGELSDWQTALWFASPTGWLGGRRPVDVLREEPDAVVEAAQREVGELVA